MSDSNQHIRIQIDLPVGVPVTIMRPESEQTKSRQRNGVTSSSPMTGSKRRVEVNGTLIATVTFDFTVAAVSAAILPDVAGLKFTATPTGDTPGNNAPLTNTWNWSGVGNQIPGTAHDATGTVKNKFVLWYKDSISEPMDEYEMIVITFFGQDNT